jgi:sugar phosphate isomerase/epimerase
VTDLARLSLNQITVDQWDVPQLVEGCLRHGIGSVSLWRHRIAETGLQRTATLVREAGLHVSSVCRGGMFPATDAADVARRAADNRRAVDEAAELGADVLVLVCGPAADRDLPRARAQVADGIAALLPYAREAGVRLGIEPLHPMMITERSVVVTLGQALDLVEQHDSPWLGVVVDAYHVWWDPELAAGMARATGRVLGYHVSDWLTPTTDLVFGRGLMGQGAIDLPALSAAVAAAGYAGPVEVEVLSHEQWRRDADELVADVRARFVDHV